MCERKAQAEQELEAKRWGLVGTEKSPGCEMLKMMGLVNDQTVHITGTGLRILLSLILELCHSISSPVLRSSASVSLDSQ